MKIALIGYGKMGHAIEEIATKRGHEIVLRIRSGNRHEMTPENLQNADVAIEFTNPESARENVLHVLNTGTPVICGSTGWNEGLDAAKAKALNKNTAFLQASNFSVGVNIFFEVNKLLASLMNDQPDYEVSIEETHHTQKKDAPSGTAITLAEQVLDNLDRKRHWVKEKAESADDFPVIAHRIEGVPGTHNVKYSSRIDDIEIIHTAHNREGFALGAVLAAEFVAGKKGIFTMQDVLGINKNR
ncbi:4-hydroxy-tetrahydrodipicolinate reductase [Polluticoccus soli]|uniref:4-hydroxy-tetrahydrodipicolinate reductase n=1 Tax=Polluticoccus soli TaxID=3034150 RepID=UPI0023E2A5D2|nr:4-hydroxy-tetrahydrodipicolinate reductase [Flavipsychrobacter sp. JY13-12]